MLAFGLDRVRPVDLLLPFGIDLAEFFPPLVVGWKLAEKIMKILRKIFLERI